MTIATMNSRTFARDAAAIKRAAQLGPVIITERGKPALAVLCIDDYYRLTGQIGGPSLLVSMQGIAAPEDVELDLPERAGGSSVLRRIGGLDDDIGAG